jgi:TPR repeat protein
MRHESAAIGYFERASNGSELDDLGGLLHVGNTERRLKGRRGNAFAQKIFGECLENCHCVKKDLVRAAEYYRL